MKGMYLAEEIFMTPPNEAVRYDVEQSLTDEQKAQARQNIGAQETIPEHTYDSYGAAETVQENLDTHAEDSTIHVNSEEKEAWNEKYVKPDEGIPKTDLSSGVQTSLEKADSALQEHQSLAAYRTSSDQDVIDNAIKDDVSNLESLIPSQASHDNQLTDKEFVNSSIGTNTAHYISDNGLPFTSVAALEAYTGTVTNNDYAFVTGTDEAGNVYYDRYKATVSESTISWAKEYRLNNSSFTAAQWASISSGITALLVSNLQSHLQNSEIHVTVQDKTNWNNKYSKPSDGIPDADLKEAHYTKSEADLLLNQKVSIQQDTEDAGKVLGIDEDGRIVPVVENDADAVHYTSETKTDAEKAQARENINAAAPDGFYGNSGGVYQYSTNFLGKNAPTPVKDLVFRPTASAMSGTAWSADSIGGDTATIERIKGKTLVFNQLVWNGNFADGTVGWGHRDTQVSVNNNICKFTGTAKNAGVYMDAGNRIAAVAGHKYYTSMSIKSTSNRVRIWGFSGFVSVYSTGSGKFERLERIYTASTSTTQYIECRDDRESGWDEVQCANAMIIDLTQIFGAGNEPATVEEFRAMFPLDYYDYNPGELISFNGTELQTTGFNQLKPDGTINVIGGMTYRIEGTYTSLVDSAGNAVTVTDNEFTPPQDDTYTMVGGLCVHLKWSGVRDGDTEDYWQRQLALPIAQYFPDGMKSAGTVYDELTKDKAVKRIGKVDLGTLDWKYDPTLVRFYASYAELKPVENAATDIANLICPIYTPTTNSYQVNNPDADYTMSLNDTPTNVIRIRNLAYTSVADFKAAMSGVYLYYELADPVITPISPELNLTYKVDDFGTEKLLPENTAEPVTAPMDADIVYQLDYEAQVRNNDQINISKASMDNFISAFNASGLGTITQTYNPNTKQYEYTVTAPQPTEGGETT